MPEVHEQLRLKNQLCFPIYLCAKEITRLYGDMLNEFDLTYTQYIVMQYFWEIGSSNVKELSAALLLDPSTLTPILKKLEAKGFITRTRSHDDERSLSIALTDRGCALQDKVMAVPVKMEECIGLDSDECSQLGTIIRKILNNVEKEKIS